MHDNRSLLAILGMLSLGPKNGYQIRAWIDRSIAHFWQESFGQIYPGLEKLLLRGLATARKDDRRGKSSRVYRITQAGRRVLSRWLAQPPAPDAARSELLLKLFFSRFAPDGAAANHIQTARIRAHATVNSLRQIEQVIRAELAHQPDFPYWMLTIRHGQIVNEARLRWCDEADQVLKNLADGHPPAKAVPAAPQPTR